MRRRCTGILLAGQAGADEIPPLVHRIVRRLVPDDRQRERLIGEQIREEDPGSARPLTEVGRQRRAVHEVANVDHQRGRHDHKQAGSAVDQLYRRQLRRSGKDDKRGGNAETAAHERCGGGNAQHQAERHNRQKQRQHGAGTVAPPRLPRFTAVHHHAPRQRWATVTKSPTPGPTISHHLVGSDPRRGHQTAYPSQR